MNPIVGWIGLAITFILVGLLLAFTNVLVLEGVGALLIWIGMVAIILGAVILIALGVRALLFGRTTRRRERFT